MSIVLRPDQPSTTVGSGGELEIFRPKRGPDLFRAYHVLVDGDDIGERMSGLSWNFGGGPHGLMVKR